MRVALSYISIPLIFAVGVTTYAAKIKPLELLPLMELFGFGALFYCTPFFFMAFIQFCLKPASPVIHSGYLGASLSLVLIASLWFFPSDQSGLPVQWMAYWPLASLLIITFAGVSFVFCKYRS
jgi:hypothetical protein